MSSNNVNNICCICLDESNQKTTNCKQCVNKFHLKCIIDWILNKDIKLIILNIICDHKNSVLNNVNCPCCRINIYDMLKYKILLCLINKYKYILFCVIIVLSLCVYVVGVFIFRFPFEFIIVLICNSFGMIIGYFIDKLCDKYNINLMQRHFS